MSRERQPASYACSVHLGIQYVLRTVVVVLDLPGMLYVVVGGDT